MEERKRQRADYNLGREKTVKKLRERKINNKRNSRGEKTGKGEGTGILKERALRRM